MAPFSTSFPSFTNGFVPGSFGGFGPQTIPGATGSIPGYFGGAYPGFSSVNSFGPTPWTNPFLGSTIPFTGVPFVGGSTFPWTTTGQFGTPYFGGNGISPFGPVTGPSFSPWHGFPANFSGAVGAPWTSVTNPWTPAINPIQGQFGGVGTPWSGFSPWTSPVAFPFTQAGPWGQFATPLSSPWITPGFGGLSFNPFFAGAIPFGQQLPGFGGYGWPGTGWTPVSTYASPIGGTTPFTSTSPIGHGIPGPIGYGSIHPTVGVNPNGGIGSLHREAA